LRSSGSVHEEATHGIGSGENVTQSSASCDNVSMIEMTIVGQRVVEGNCFGKHAQGGMSGGHLPAKVGGRPCPCGAMDDEAEASGWSLTIPGARMARVLGEQVGWSGTL